MLAPKLNATCVYTFPENVKVGLAIRTSLRKEADLRNMYSAKIRTHPLKLQYYITFWSVEKLHTGIN